MTKQTLYEKIRTVVESGNIAITQNEETKRFNLWSSLYWEWIRVSGSFDSINECYNHLWEHYLTEWETDIAQEWWERYIWIYERPLWRPELWDNIMLLERAKDVKEMYGNQNLTYKYKEFCWKKCEVHLLWDYFCQIRIEWEWLFRVPYDCIAPRVEVDEI